jgi:hypothetical protein
MDEVMLSNLTFSRPGMGGGMVTPTGFGVALILFCYNNITPTGFKGGVDSSMLKNC